MKEMDKLAAESQSKMLLHVVEVLEVLRARANELTVRVGKLEVKGEALEERVLSLEEDVKRMGATVVEREL